MSKILAISDIHIHDYPQRNPSEKYRLYQTRTVIQNIINAAQQEGADILVIAGDIMDKWNPRPYVQAEIKNFLDTLMSYFKEGYIIWGNHDQDNKTENSEFIDSCLAVMLPPNLMYADKYETIIDGCRIGFMNWRPKFDLSWIQGKLDILFTHATICYSDTDQFTSQKLDESKFDLAICGDIHRPASKGKYVSIGIPQRCKMSDGEDSTGVIIDTTTKTWQWVNLNPSDNLMKFQYTGVRGNEGWDQNTGTWNVYKPDNLSISGGIRDITIPAWEEINKLTDQIIAVNGLDSVHGEVLKNIQNRESLEVDFDFVLTHFHCKNWRSIDDCDLYFDDLDRILITGENGSGKSSLLSAIRYAFIENRSVKDFLQFGTKECETTVEFLYQGNQYKIERGFKGRGGYTRLWMNGEEQKANSKTDLDEDIHVRFPFIDYMDVYFFDSDHHKLIGGITPERKSEIVSKFYKMDKIDLYHEEAQRLFAKEKEEIDRTKVNIEKGLEVLKYVNSNLDNLKVPSLSEVELQKKKQEGLILQGKWKAWNDYTTQTAFYQSRINIYRDKITDLEKQISMFRDPSILQSEIQSYRDKITWIQGEIQKLQTIEIEGKQKRSEFDNIRDSGVCKACGRPLDNQEERNARLLELDRELQDLTQKWTTQNEYIKSHIGDPSKVIGECNTSMARVMSEKSIQDRTKNELSQAKTNLLREETNLRNLGQAPEKVELPQGFMDEMSKIETSLAEWAQYNKLQADKAHNEEQIRLCQEYMNTLQAQSQNLQDYIRLTGPTGKIYEEIMTRLATQFSDNQVVYKVERSMFRKKEHLDLSSYYLNNGNEVSYQACSSGQKTILDINFLGKIVTRMGLLVMDEFLKHLDAKNHDICIDMLKEMNIGCILLSSHMESVPAFNNKSITLELNESGVSKIQMK